MRYALARKHNAGISCVPTVLYVEREGPIDCSMITKRFRQRPESTSDFGASRGSILNSRDAEEVLSYNVT